MTDDQFTEMAQLAAERIKAEKLLRWAVLLLAAMALILVIDLQLKRSISRQAMTASKLLSGAVTEHGTARDRAAASPGGDSAGGSGGGAVDGSTPMAAGDGDTGGQASASQARRAGGPVKRAARDGGRAGGAAG